MCPAAKYGAGGEGQASAGSAAGSQPQCLAQPAGSAAGSQPQCLTPLRPIPLQRELRQVRRLASGGAQLRAPCAEGQGCCWMPIPPATCCRRPGAGAYQAPGRSPRRVPQRGRGPTSPLPRGALVNPLKPSGGCWVPGNSPLSLSLGGMAARCHRAAGLPPAGQPVRVEAGPAGWLACFAPPLEATAACGWVALCGLGRLAEAAALLLPDACCSPLLPGASLCVAAAPLPSPSWPCFMGRSMQLTSPYTCAWPGPGAGRLLHTVCATCLPPCFSRLTATYMCCAPSCGGD